MVRTGWLLMALLLTVLLDQLAFAQGPGAASSTASGSPLASTTGQASIGRQGESTLGDYSSFNPPMIGDLGLYGKRLVARTVFFPVVKNITVPVTTFVTNTTTTREIVSDPINESSFVLVTNTITTSPVTTLTTQQQVNTQSRVDFFRLPIAAPALKIAENESPRPTDRVYLGYNFYDGLGCGDLPGSDVHRETIGFERTFLDGDASIGLRVPVFQQGNGPGLSLDGFGAASAILKLAFINDLRTGDVLSAGLMVTVPTGRSVLLADGDSLNTVFIQPWVGFIYNMGDFYTHGFSSVVFPTDARNVAFMSNDIGLGYRLFRSAGALSSFTPTVEAHIFTPLSNRDEHELVRAYDSAVITAGGVWGFGSDRVLLTTAAAFSLVGPKPFDLELIAQLNVRF